MQLLDAPAGATYTAVVSAADGVLLSVSSTTAEERSARLMEYVCARYEHALWPNDAARLHEVIEHGDAQRAIAVYFDRVGRRWDEERLELHDPVVIPSAARDLHLVSGSADSSLRSE